MGSLGDIILEVIGRGDDAKRELDEIAAKALAFDKIAAEAVVTVDNSKAVDTLKETSVKLAEFARKTTDPKVELDIGEAQRDLDEMKGALDKLDLSSADPKIQIDAAAASLKITELQARLAKLDATDVNIDVDIRRGIVEEIGGLLAKTGSLARGFDGLATSAAGLAGPAGDAAGGLGDMSEAGAILGPVIKAAAAFIGIALVGALFSLVAVAASAVTALAAIGVAGVGALFPLGALIKATVDRFGEMKDKAGSAAAELDTRFKAISDTFRKALAPAADAVLGGLADGLKGVAPLVDKLAPAFKTLGVNMGDAVKGLGAALTSPGVTKGLQDLIKGSSDLIGPIADGVGSLAKILLDIANAAMPLLVNGAKDAAKWLGDLAKSIDPKALAKGIGDMGTDLANVGKFAATAGDAILQLFNGAIGPGREFLQFLTDGIAKFVAFAKTPEGHQEIVTFFHQAVTTIEGVIGTLVDLGTIVIRVFTSIEDWGQRTATSLAQWANPLIDVINFLTGADIPHLATETTNALQQGDQAAKVFTTSLDRLKANAIQAGLGIGKAFNADAAEKNVGGFVGVGLKLEKVLRDGGKKAGEGMGDALAEAAKAQEGAAGKAGDALGEALRDGADKQKEMEKLGKTLAHAMADGAKSVINAIKEQGRKLGDALESGADDKRDSNKGAGKRLGDAVTAGIKSTENDVRGRGRDLGTQGAAGVDDKKGAGEGSGKGWGGAVVSGIDGKKGDANKAGGGLADEAGKGATGAKDGAKSDGAEVGAALVQGLHDGIVAAGSAGAGSAFAQIVREAMQAGKNAANSKSPSKETMKLGKDMVAGLAIGISDNSALSALAMQGAVDDVMRAIGPVGQEITVPGGVGLPQAAGAASGPQVVIQSFHPTDPAILAQLARTVNTGNALAANRSNSTSPVGVPGG